MTYDSLSDFLWADIYSRSMLRIGWEETMERSWSFKDLESLKTDCTGWSISSGMASTSMPLRIFLSIKGMFSSSSLWLLLLAHDPKTLLSLEKDFIFEPAPVPAALDLLELF